MTSPANPGRELRMAVASLEVVLCAFVRCLFLVVLESPARRLVTECRVAVW
jgi:hypothetical protein